MKKYKIGNRSNPQVSDAFATGLLHELPLCFLAKISPGAFNRVFLYAQRHLITFGQSFEALYGNSLAELGKVAVHSWGIPQEYCEYFWYADQPWLAELSFDVISSIVYADGIANSTDFKIEAWALNPRIPLEVQEAFEFSPDDLQAIVQEVPDLALAA